MRPDLRMDARVTALRAALRAGVPLTVAQRDELATARRESDRLAADLARLQARFRALRDRADGADGAGA